jgi:rhodanese-related sulfurtransferase
VKTLSTDDLKEMRNRGEQFTLINVLPAEEFASTRIPGAISIPLEAPNFPSRVEQILGTKEGTVVTYCASDDCPASTKAAEQLAEGGFTRVFDYKGGAAAWQEAEHATGAQV